VLSHEDRRVVVEKTVVTPHHTAMINMFAVVALTATNVPVFAGDPGSRFTLECKTHSQIYLSEERRMSGWGAYSTIVFTFELTERGGRVYDWRDQSWRQLQSVDQHYFIIHRGFITQDVSDTGSFENWWFNRDTGEYTEDKKIGASSSTTGTCTKGRLKPAPEKKF
jgi:hypothetical protein